MKVEFRGLAMLSAFLFFSLALIWMFAPNLLLSAWGVELTSSAELLGRRGAALYAGISVMLFSARNTTPSPARSALVSGFVVACLVLAALCFFELTAGHANSGILMAAFIEGALALAFLYAECLRTKRSEFGHQRLDIQTRSRAQSTRLKSEIPVSTGKFDAIKKKPRRK